MTAMEICVLRTESVRSTQQIIPTTANAERDILENIVKILVGRTYPLFYAGMRFLAVLIEKFSAAVVQASFGEDHFLISYMLRFTHEKRPRKICTKYATNQSEKQMIERIHRSFNETRTIVPHKTEEELPRFCSN